MDEVAEALEKYKGLVPLVYDIETMSLDEARPEDMQTAVYLKREADKVIAELKAQKAQAEDDCAYWKTMSRKCADDNEVMAKQRADAFKRERHQKYKRCLAIAKWWGLVSVCTHGEIQLKCMRRELKYHKLAEKFNEGV